ncbi:ribosome biogenesis GTPase [Alkalithermobacter thermoalcaliphilus JW-YL-7 = DSM 7308]|uniref:Small ribosomal subunit biogenesis GTPase RsgA n=1 Tax=Alkalithermobacter thermoalcaliphilus JW-YL-7 = DSM 7308 TaxID=1121328 RepID=A0A150FPW5_CLOPD|nr:ribosome biogenesis GTPase RsgA [[Clostridium] paradoxum JW-YL-7 = DSM 7308]SHK96217.1 ribosome biogenesis GTPase [[Clostridium] paradoxum JW-YL-7 = DSM 7308]
MLKGRILKGIGGFYYIDTAKGLYECKARGIFRKKKLTPLVGDIVDIQVIDEENKKAVIENIYERTTELIRPPIANVSKAVIVFSVTDPKPNFSLLDRFIVLSEKEGLDIAICITKVDLDDNDEFSKIKDVYKDLYKVIPVSNKLGLGIDEVKKELKGHISVFAGPSGVGKSSLLNSIDSNLNLQVGQISEKVKRGKHTTRHAQLIKLEEECFVADTPGFSSLLLSEIDTDELKEYFIEFKDLAFECKFYKNCLHENEPGCRVKEALDEGRISNERYSSYIQLLNEIKDTKRRY